MTLINWLFDILNYFERRKSFGAKPSVGSFNALMALFLSYFTNDEIRILNSEYTNFEKVHLQFLLNLFDENLAHVNMKFDKNLYERVQQVIRSLDSAENPNSGENFLENTVYFVEQHINSNDSSFLVRLIYSDLNDKQKVMNSLINF